MSQQLTITQPPKRVSQVLISNMDQCGKWYSAWDSTKGGHRLAISLASPIAFQIPIGVPEKVTITSFPLTNPCIAFAFSKIESFDLRNSDFVIFHPINYQQDTTSGSEIASVSEPRTHSLSNELRYLRVYRYENVAGVPPLAGNATYFNGILTSLSFEGS